jgi:hypothetical protein
MTPTPPRFVLRDLPQPARFVIAAFLVTAGVGYLSGLVQLHFQSASPGKLLPGPDDAVRIFTGRPTMSQLERVLVTDEGAAFTGSGSMRSAFTTRSAGWMNHIKKKAQALKLSPRKADDLARAEKELRLEREGEILVVLDWIHNGANQEAYDQNSYPLAAKLAEHPITEQYVQKDADGKTTFLLKDLFDNRCARCHAEGKGGPAGSAPLESYDEIHTYAEVETGGGGMSLPTLAQTTHVHLLSFGMLFGLTGLAFAFTSYPAWVRFLLAPLPLVAQAAEIVICWWGGRALPELAMLIPATSALVAAGLVCQIILSLFNMYRAMGKAVLALLLLGALAAGYALKVGVVDPYMARESQTAPTLSTGTENSP